MNNILRILIITVVSAVCALLTPVAAQPQADDSLHKSRAFDYWYLQALALKEQGVHDAALGMFEHCLDIAPGSPAVLFELSNYYMYLGRKSEALTLMQRAVKEEPGNFWYRQILATAYENNGMRDKAIDVYESMAADFPTNTEMHLILAAIYAEEGMYEKALGAYTDYERHEGKSEQISMQKFNICMLMQDSAKAIEEACKLVADNPDEPRYQVLLGEVYMQNGNPSRAYGIYRDVLSSSPGNINAQLAIANYHKQTGDDSLFRISADTLLMNPKLSSAARSELLVKIIAEIEQSGGDSIYITDLCERLVALPGNQLPTATVYAQYLMMKDADESAVTPLLHKILQMEPENRMAQLQLLSYAIQRKDYADIVLRADTAILYNPEILQLYYYRGIACYQLKRPEEALATFRQGLQKRGEDTEAGLISELFTLVGDTEHELGNQAATLVAYDSALLYNPHNIVVLNNYAYYLALEERDLERAAEMSLRTLKEEPDNPIYIDTYMWILFLQKRYDEARAYAEKLMAGNAEMSIVEYVHCGDIFAMCGDIEAAMDCWLEAQKMGDESKILKKKIKKKRYIPDGKNKR